MLQWFVSLLLYQSILITILTNFSCYQCVIIRFCTEISGAGSRDFSVVLKRKKKCKLMAADFTLLMVCFFIGRVAQKMHQKRNTSAFLMCSCCNLNAFQWGGAVCQICIKMQQAEFLTPFQKVQIMAVNKFMILKSQVCNYLFKNKYIFKKKKTQFQIRASASWSFCFGTNIFHFGAPLVIMHFCIKMYSQEQNGLYWLVVFL